MKRVFSLLLSIAMLLSMSACCLPMDQLTNSLQNIIPAQSSFALGTTDGQNYENTFIGIGCNLERGWSFATEEEIREVNNLVEDVLDEDLAEALKNADVVYDMMATSLDQTHNIIVTMEKVNPIQLATLDIAKNYEVIYPPIEQSFKDMGYKNIMHKVDTITVDGKEMDALIITADIHGINIYQTTFCIKCNGYLASVGVTSVGVNTNAKLLDTFYWVD